jgi:hypothetical protein
LFGSFLCSAKHLHLTSYTPYVTATQDYVKNYIQPIITNIRLLSPHHPNYPCYKAPYELRYGADHAFDSQLLTSVLDLADMGMRPTKNLPAFKKALKLGKNLTEAKIAAGYSPNTASMGVHQLPKPFKAAWAREQAKYIALARAHSPEDQENVARGALLSNVYEGKDRSVQSIKLLGQDKRVNMFTADNQVGVIVIQPPAQLMTELSKRLGSEPKMLEAVTITSDSDTPSDPDPTPL